MSADKSSHVATEAFRILRTLYQLSNDIFASENRQDLCFRMLNNTIQLFPYKRAVLWAFEGKQPKLTGISGQENVNPNSPLAELWNTIILSVKDNKSLQLLNNKSSGLENIWERLAEKTSGLSVMWVPILVNDQLRAVLWLERWKDDKWDSSECEIMSSLAQNYSLAWKHFNRSSGLLNKIVSGKNRVFTAIVCPVVIFFLYFQTISLRVVAPCEIIPKDQVLITAPLDGVVKEILIQPGDHVKKGDLLFNYESRIIIQELKVAQKEVEIIKSQYNRARLRAFKDNKAMEEIRSLKYRLEQEDVRLKLAVANSKYLEVHAPIDGICMVDNPEYWIGRPVQIGERIMLLFQAEKNKVRIYLPESDNILFDRKKPVKIILNADPASKHTAILSYISPQVSQTPQGGAAFIAEAEFKNRNTTIKVGSKGSAIVYGESVRLIYWLLRKPLAGFRLFFGI